MSLKSDFVCKAIIVVLVLAVIIVPQGAFAQPEQPVAQEQQTQQGQQQNQQQVVPEGMPENYVYQEGECLEKYKTKDYVVTKNPKWNFVKKAKYKAWNKLLKALFGEKNFYKSKKGVTAKFQRWLRIEMDNPQSIAVTPDGNTMYIMNAIKGSASKEYEWVGYIWKIDLKGLKKDAVVKQQLAQDGYIYVNTGNINNSLREPDPVPKGKAVNDKDYAYRKYVMHSEEMVTGHGQTMAYNPKDGKLWYLPYMKQKMCRAICVDPKTLKQEAAIDFLLKSSVKCPSTLTFDKNGNAYFYMKAGGSKWAPKNTAKIYRGTLTPKQASFFLVMKGIRYSPGTVVQSMGYNPKRNRLYLVSDRSIISVPVSKMNKSKLAKYALLPTDIQTSIFKESREFEGITFDKAGNGYFLTNRPDEVMLVNKGY